MLPYLNFKKPAPIFPKFTLYENIIRKETLTAKNNNKRKQKINTEGN